MFNSFFLFVIKFFEFIKFTRIETMFWNRVLKNFENPVSDLNNIDSMDVKLLELEEFYSRESNLMSIRFDFFLRTYLKEPVLDRLDVIKSGNTDINENS